MPPQPRRSNIELLRIISMAMVLVLHMVLYYTGGGFRPTLKWAVAAGVQTMCIGAVDVFVMISGWFGIRPSRRGFAKFMFQVLWISAMVVVIMMCAGAVPSWDAPLAMAGLRGAGWFVVSYVGLYVFAPVLNAFIQTADIRRHALVVVCFYILSTLTLATDSGPEFQAGYSMLSFFGLYLLASLLKRLRPEGMRRGWCVYLAATALLCLQRWAVTLTDAAPLRQNILAYNNPLVIAAAAGLLLWFASVKMRHSRLVNTVAASCFAVYLLHAHLLVSHPFFFGTS